VLLQYELITIQCPLTLALPRSELAQRSCIIHTLCAWRSTHRMCCWECCYWQGRKTAEGFNNLLANSSRLFISRHGHRSPAPLLVLQSFVRIEVDFQYGPLKVQFPKYRLQESAVAAPSLRKDQSHHPGLSISIHKSRAQRLQHFQKLYSSPYANHITMQALQRSDMVQQTQQNLEFMVVRHPRERMYHLFLSEESFWES